MTGCDTANFLVQCFFGQPSRPFVAYHIETSGMQLHDVFGLNCNKTGFY